MEKEKQDELKHVLKHLQQQIEQATTPFEIEKLQERFAKFVGGVGIIHVGGLTRKLK